MAAPIRPDLPSFPATRPTAAPAAEAARAAQRAFFAQALNGVQAAAPEAAASEGVARAVRPEPARQPVHVDRVNIPAEPPERPSRPGSYLDIKV